MNKDYLNELCGVFAQVRTSKEALKLLEDVLTPHELASVVERWQIVKRLIKGVPQREISGSLKVSISKVTRGSRALKRTSGGFTRFLGRKK